MYAIEHIDWASDLPQANYATYEAHRTALQLDIRTALYDLDVPDRDDELDAPAWELEVHTLHGPGGGWPEITLRFARLAHLVAFAQVYFEGDE